MRMTLAILAATAAAAAAGAALACSCMPFGSAAEQLAASQLAFKGEVMSEQSTAPGQAQTRFRVVEVLKGPGGRTVTVQHRLSSAACGVRYRPGKTVWVFANRAPDGAWRTGSCSTARFDEADYRRAARGQPVPTQPRVM